MKSYFTPPRCLQTRFSEFGKKIASIVAAGALLTSCFPVSAIASPHEATAAAPSLDNIGDIAFSDMPRLDSTAPLQDISPDTLANSGASSLVEYEDEGMLGGLFSERSVVEGSLPTQVDGTKIESLKAVWRTPDEKDDGTLSRLSLVPDDDAQRTVLIAVESALSGQYDYEPGDITFTVPKTFLKYRDGSSAGVMKLSVPASPSSIGTFAYIDNGDTYSIVNTKDLPSATSVLIQLEVNSIDVTHMRGDGSPSERFWCDLIVKGGENDELIGMTNNDLFATFETDAQVKNVNNTVQGFYEKYPDSFPAEIKPSNDGDYVYVDWYSYAHIEGNQYFDISVASNLTGYAGGIVLGMKDDGGTVYQGNGSANLASNLASGVYRTGQGYYVHTYAAYPKSGLKNDVTSTFNHEAVYNLDTADTRRASSARASATKSYTPKEWERPVGFFGISKYAPLCS